MEDKDLFNEDFVEDYSASLSYMDDDDIRAMSYGTITNPRIYNYDGSYSPDGLFSEKIFGPQYGATCLCGNIHENGLYCSECGTQAEKNTWKTRLGHIELPIGWYGDNKSLIAMILGSGNKNTDISSIKQALDSAWRNESFILVAEGANDTKEIQGPIEIEKAIKAMEGKEDIVIANLQAKIDASKSRIRKLSPINNNFSQEENYLEGLEEGIEALKAMKTAGMKYSSLLRHAIPVLPPSFRRISEIGEAPEGKYNAAYIKILEASKTLVVAMENRNKTTTPFGIRIAEQSLKQAEREYANALLEANETLNMINGKKGVGRVSQNLDIPDSYGAVAVPDKNLDIDEIRLPYEALLKMFRKETLQELRQKYDELISNTQTAIDNGRIDEERGEMEIDGYQQQINMLRVRLLKETETRHKVEERDPEILDALERATSNRLCIVLRYPVTTRASIIGCRIQIGDGFVIGMNPATCEQMKADFDGDQLWVSKVPKGKSTEIVYNKLWVGNIQNSPTTGEPMHANEREDTLGIYLMTRKDNIEDYKFKRDVIIDSIQGEVVDGKLTTEGLITAYHIMGAIPEDAKPVEVNHVFGKGEIIAFNKDGSPIRSENMCYVKMVDNKPLILAVSRDHSIIAPGSELKVKAGELVKAGSLLATASSMHFKSITEIKDAYQKGLINANRPIYVSSKNGEEVETTAGRIIVSTLLSPPGRFLLYNRQMGKKEVNIAVSKLQELVPDTREMAVKILENLKLLQAYGSAYSENYSGFTPYDVYKFVYNEKGILEADKNFNANSILDQVLSGAKGSMKNVELLLKAMTGYDVIKDSEAIVNEVQKLDKGGKSQNNGMQPIQESGMWQRLMSNALEPYEVEMEDCGTRETKTIQANNSNIENEIKNRTLGENYTCSNGKTYYKGDIIHPTIAKQIAYDMAISNKDIKIRSMSECKCNGVCASCYGADPSTSKPVSIGQRIGVDAAGTITSIISEGMVLKGTSNTGREDSGTALSLGEILEGSPAAWEAGIKSGKPEDSLFTIEQELKKLVWEKIGEKVSSQHVEIIAKAMTGVECNGQHIGYGKYVRDYKDKVGTSDLKIMPRIRGIKTIANSGQIESRNNLPSIKTGGTRASENLATIAVRNKGEQEIERNQI